MDIYFRNSSIIGIQGNIAEKDKFISEYVEYANENNHKILYYLNDEKCFDYVKTKLNKNEKVTIIGKYENNGTMDTEITLTMCKLIGISFIIFSQAPFIINGADFLYYNEFNRWKKLFLFKI